MMERSPLLVTGLAPIVHACSATPINIQQNSLGRFPDDTSLYSVKLYAQTTDIDSPVCFDIIRRHLASQATSAATVETAVYELP
jgi:hypothetical protein